MHPSIHRSIDRTRVAVGASSRRDSVVAIGARDALPMATDRSVASRSARGSSTARPMATASRAV